MLSSPTGIPAAFAVAILVVAAPSHARQAVFVDDFDGDSLLPHWGLPRSEDWDYHVSDGALHVTGLNYPSDPHAPINFAAMGALFAPQGEFTLDARLGWEEGPGPQRIALEARTGANGTIGLATLMYSYQSGFGPDPVLALGALNTGLVIPAPEPGMHDFRIQRSAGNFRFYVDGELLLTVADEVTSAAATAVVLDFAGPFLAPMSPFVVDRVVVVPAPSAMVVWVTAIGLVLRRQRAAAE